MSDVVVTRWIAASPPTVFAFFTDIERWAAWQGVGGKVDARAGGALRVIMPDAAAASGQFIEVVPPRRIVFTWGWEGTRFRSRQGPRQSRSSSSRPITARCSD